MGDQGEQVDFKEWLGINSSPRRITSLGLFLLAVLASVAPVLAEGEESGEGSGYAWLLALGLSLVHLSTPLIKPALERFRLELGSFGGGAAISYLFLHLLPELEEGNEYIKGHIYGVVLVGFIVIYGLKTLNEGDDHKSGRLALTQACVYSWLLIFGLSSDHMGDLTLVILATVALSFHLLNEDQELSEEYPQLFQAKSRYLLAAMPLLGLASRSLPYMNHEAVKSLVTAVLAGMIMYNSFADGLPSGGNRKAFRWFVVGSIVYGCLAVVIIRLQS